MAGPQIYKMVNCVESGVLEFEESNKLLLASYVGTQNHLLFC